MIGNEHKLEVLLDKNANIVEFYCNFPDIDIDPEEVIGKNWFDIFISSSDQAKVLEVFKNILEEKTDSWKTYKNDVKFDNYGHKLIDFENQILMIDGEKYLKSYGIEYMHNI